MAIYPVFNAPHSLLIYSSGDFLFLSAKPLLCFTVLFFFFSCLAAFWSWLSNSPYWHLVRPWYHVQRGAGRGVAFHDLLRHRRKQQPCSTGSFITVSCPCIWTSCFQIALGLALTVVDWEVSAWLSWNTHGADGNVLSEAFMHMQLVQRKTSQISLLLPAVLRVSCWMDS